MSFFGFFMAAPLEPQGIPSDFPVVGTFAGAMTFPECTGSFAGQFVPMRLNFGAHDNFASADIPSLMPAEPGFACVE